MSLQDFESLAVQLFPSACRLLICSGGEPYLHNGLEDTLRIAKRYRFFTFVSSNGMLATEQRLRPIVLERLISEHGFSVDGAKPATVESIRVKAKLDAIVENIRNLIRIRDGVGRQQPVIVIRYALMRCNIEEAPEAVRMWGEIGVDRIDCGCLSLANDIDPNECLFFHRELMERVRAETLAVARHYPRLEVSLPALILHQVQRKEHPSPCPYPWSFVYIDTNGTVLPCYCAYEGMQMGKIYGDGGAPFPEIWNGPAYRRLRARVNEDSVDKSFKYCDVCEYRFGWGDLAAHLGDQTWIAALSDSKRELINIDHRRGKRRSAAERPKRLAGSG